MAANSKRVYVFTYATGLPLELRSSDGNSISLEPFNTEQLSIGYLLSKDNPEGDLESKYAIQDVIDEVLDLKAGESMYLSANRDRPDETKGVLIRIR